MAPFLSGTSVQLYAFEWISVRVCVVGVCFKGKEKFFNF